MSMRARLSGTRPPADLPRRPLRMVFISFDKPTHWLMQSPTSGAVKDLKDKKVAVDGLGGTLGVSAFVSVGKTASKQAGTCRFWLSDRRRVASSR